MLKLKYKGLCLASCLLAASWTAEAGRSYQRLNGEDFPNATLSVVNDGGRQFAVIEAYDYELGVADFMDSADNILAYGVVEDNRIRLYSYEIQRQSKNGSFAYTQRVDAFGGNPAMYGEEYIYYMSFRDGNVSLSSAKPTKPEAGGYYEFNYDFSDDDFISLRPGLQSFIAGYNSAH